MIDLVRFVVGHLKMFRILCAIFMLQLSSAAKLPSNYKKCSIKDLDCLKDAIQDALPKIKEGIPSMGVPALDPLIIPAFDVPAGGSAVQFKQVYKDAQLYGVSAAKLDKLVFDIDNGKMEFDISVPFVRMNGTYQFDGKLLVFPVRGNGKCMLHTENVKGHLIFDVEVVTKGKEKFIKGKKSDLKLQVGFAKMQFDNLIDGNEELSDTVNKALNDSWELVVNEVLAGYSQVFGIYFMNLMNQLFAKVPISEAFND